MTAVLLPSPVPRHMSYSQSTTLGDCGLKYFLERVVHAPYPPSWAAVGGKAMHLATEWIDRHEAAPDFFLDYLTRHYGAVLRWAQTETDGSAAPDDRVIQATAENSQTATVLAYLDGVSTVESEEWATNETIPGSVRELWEHCFAEEIAGESARAAQGYRSPDSWKSFGKANKTWPDKENRAWWDHHGPIFIMRWINWRMTSGYTLIYLDGDESLPAIEVDCSGSLGPVQIKGFIDRLFLDPFRQPVILDLKSNSRLPTEGRQMALYRLMLKAMGFPPPAKGVYWWARSGELGDEIDLTVPDFDEARLVWEMKNLRDRRNNGDFQANTNSVSCSYCGVKPYCYAKGGELADLAPRPWELSGIEIKS